VFDEIKSTFEVPRVERPSRREFEERFFFPQRPVIISGAMEGWPARELWTNDYLLEKVGDRTIEFWTKAHQFFDDPKKDPAQVGRRAPMKLAEYIDMLADTGISDGNIYAAMLQIKTDLPELWPDVRFPPFVDEDKYRLVNFWFGPGNTFTPLHYDIANNLLAQIRGRKQLLLCPPSEITRLYPFPFSYWANRFSQVNVLSPDLTRFPGWARTDRALVELRPGEMLFIPLYWWHAVSGIDQNIAINYWWRPRLANLLQNPRQTAAWTAKKFSGRYTERARGLARSPMGMSKTGADL
jgi:lysine-specific demethylase 8